MPQPKSYAFAGSTITVLVPGEDTGGLYAVLHVIKPSGSSTPPHSHDRESEVALVLSGSLGIETEGATRRLAPGGWQLLPPARPHRLFNDSGSPVHELLVCAPAMFDRFVAAAGREVPPFADPRPMADADRRSLAEAAPRHGIRLLSSADPDRPAAGVADPGEPWAVPGVSVLPLTRVGAGDRELVLLRATMAPGASLPARRDADPICFVVTSGALEVRSGGAPGWARSAPEQAAFVPGDAPYAVRNAAVGTTSLLMILTPPTARALAGAGSRPPDGGVEPSARPAAPT